MHAVQFTVKIVNKTGKAFDPSLFTSSVQSGNAEGSAIYDTKVGERPTTKVLDGREVSLTIAFSVKDKSDLVLEFAPDFEHESVLYQS